MDALKATADEYERRAKETLQKAEAADEAVAQRRAMLSAERAAGITRIGGGTRTKKMEAEAQALRDQAAREMQQADENQKRADEANIKAEEHLAKIESKIEKLLALRE
jgi:hypothetical protein